MDLRQRLDRLTATFTEELLRLIASASLEELAGRPHPKSLGRRAQADAIASPPAGRGPARRLEPAPAIRRLPKMALKSDHNSPRPKSLRDVAGSRSQVTSSQQQPGLPPQPAPKSADSVIEPIALERALLRALRSGLPMAAEDLFDAAGIGSSQHESAGVALDGLLATGQVGKAGFAGSSLFFPKRTARPSSRRGANHPEPSAPAMGVPIASVPTAAWRPVVIRRKKFPGTLAADERQPVILPEVRVDEVTAVTEGAQAS